MREKIERVTPKADMVQEKVPRPKDSSNSWSPPAKSKVNWTPTPETTDSSENKTEVSNSPMAGTEIDWLSRLEDNIISARANGKTPPHAVAFNPELIQNSQAQGETSAKVQQELEKTSSPSQGNSYAFAAVAVGGGILILFAAGAFIVYWQRTEQDREEVLRVIVDWASDTVDSATDRIVAGLKNINESFGFLRDSIKDVVSNIFQANKNNGDELNPASDNNADSGDFDVPDVPVGGLKGVDDRWLKKQGVDPHTVKEVLPGPAKEFDIYKDKDNNLWGLRKPKYVPNAIPEYLGNLDDFKNLDD